MSSMDTEDLEAYFETVLVVRMDGEIVASGLLGAGRVVSVGSDAAGKCWTVEGWTKVLI